MKISGQCLREIEGDRMPRFEAHTWSECDHTCTDVPGAEELPGCPTCDNVK